MDVLKHYNINDDLIEDVAQILDRHATLKDVAQITGLEPEQAYVVARMVCLYHFGRPLEEEAPKVTEERGMLAAKRYTDWQEEAKARQEERRRMALQEEFEFKQALDSVPAGML